ncbi:hypothetical protein QMK19_23180 [Streptomyces sp. H10-C2]|uniref:hypothetical protein n=1 Tax=unclassified Streptomyces TaxID=2593676 RepID=UPI0024B9C97B|nr:MULTISPECIES: hypothetical protein [unclassified Streptomyces]MDJ0342810.1 hypothetical protein [Streptomyces sp. PH10-H1]MDJ0372488.1 hypothetical protein [Streptomyces sp. H10-C2]
MSQHPSLYCACQSRVLVSERIEHPDGSREVASLTCTYCAASWEAYETPALPGPDYAVAYMSTTAADLMDQELALLLLSDDNANVTAPDFGKRRGALLREAALLDIGARRVELGWFCWQAGCTGDDVDHATATADQAARSLRAFDLRLVQVYVAGPLAADSRAWDVAGGLRSYVRQEYCGWRRATERTNSATTDRQRPL